MGHSVFMSEGKADDRTKLQFLKFFFGNCVCHLYYCFLDQRVSHALVKTVRDVVALSPSKGSEYQKQTYNSPKCELSKLMPEHVSSDPSFTTYQLCHGEGNGFPLQYSCLENLMGGGAWWAAVHGVAKSQTQLSDFTFTFHFHTLEKEMATHSSVLALRIPGTGEPGGLPSMGSHRVGHD